MRLGMAINGAIWVLLLAIFAVVSLAVPAGRPTGNLDTSFGQGGEVVVQPNSSCATECVAGRGSQAEALALAPGGSVVLAGNSTRGTVGGRRSWLVRLESNGTPDRAFGVGGTAEGQRGLSMLRVRPTKDGGVLALVSRSSGGGGFGVERFTSAGIVDSSFGNNGVRWLRAPIERQVEGAFDSKGRIVVLGEAPGHGGPVVARFAPSGEPDGGFGRNGVAMLRLLRDAEPLRMATEPSSAIVVAGAGASPTDPAESLTLLARLTGAGATDRGFGHRGVIEAAGAFGAGLSPLVLAAGHGVYLATSALHRGGAGGTDTVLVARYTRKGADKSFGLRGIAERTLPAGRGGRLIVQAMVIDGSGNAVLVGEHRDRSIDAHQGNWFLSRYTQSGRDCSFRAGGTVEGMSGGANAVVIQPDQRIVIAGWGPDRPDGAGTAFMAARYSGGVPAKCP